MPPNATIRIELMFEEGKADMRKEFVEALLMSKQDRKITVNIYSCQGGEYFKSCQTIEKAHIIVQNIILVWRSGIKKIVRVMELGELIHNPSFIIVK